MFVDPSPLYQFVAATGIIKWMLLPYRFRSRLRHRSSLRCSYHSPLFQRRSYVKSKTIVGCRCVV